MLWAHTFRIYLDSHHQRTQKRAVFGISSPIDKLS